MLPLKTFTSRRWPENINPFQLVAGETLLAVVLVFPFAVVFGAPLSVPQEWGRAEIGILVFVLAGAVESWIYFHLINSRGSVLVSFGYFVALFAGIGWGMLIFAETHSPATWLSVGLLVLALWLVRPREEPAYPQGD